MRMHPMALLGILATGFGLVAVAVGLFQLSRFGLPVGRALMDAATAIPYLILILGGALWLSLVSQRGWRAWPYLLTTLVLTLLTYLLFNR